MGLLEIFNGSKRRENRELLRLIHQQERALSQAIQHIELFPGALEEFEVKQGGKYEFVTLPNGSTFMQGGTLRWQTSIDDPIPRRESYSLSKISFPGFYSEIKAQAAEVGAEAIVEYKEYYSRRGIEEQGRPVKRIQLMDDA